MNTNKSTLSIAIALAMLSHSTLANTEQDEIEVITVTSDFRESSLQATPVSATVLSADEISSVSAQNLEEVISLAPNLNFSAGSQRARYYQIRGIGERSQFQEPINPSVGVIIDDVDFTGIGSVSSMFDVEQVEVLRGPQGTQFGANALGGLINIKTPDASEQFEGRVKLTAGNYDSYGAGLMLSGPIAEQVNYRLAVEQYQSDGFIENDYLNQDDTNNRDELSARAKVQWSVNDEVTVDFGAFIFDFDNGYDAFSLDNNRTTLSDQPGVDKQDTRAFTVKLNSTAYHYAELDLIFSHADSELTYGYDEDWAYVGIHPWEYSSTDYYFRDKKVSTAEYRLTSTQASKLYGNTVWVAGVYAKTEEEDLTRQYTYLDSNFSSSFEADTLAGYVQFDSQLTDALMLTTGLRIERRDFDYDNSDGYQAKPDENMVGGKVVLAYTLANQDLVYGSVNRGYKAGGVNTDGTLPETLREFESETVWNFELGYKANFDDGFIRAAAFYMNRDDMQVKSSQELKRPDGSSEFLIYLGNAAQGSNYGLELESGWQLNDMFSLNASVGYLDSELDDYINQDGVDISGREQAHAPKYTAYLGLNVDISDALSASIGISAKDEFYFSDSHDEKSDAEVLLNASVTYSADNWTITAWGRNLTDEEYKTRGFYFGNDPRDGYQGKQYYQLGEPAVFGLTVDYHF
ncbi:TonB-dependent receptor [Thalassotalea sp. M1531]|uniref:TonB-dependent receptor n=1 Tax=Thalassotalea algicola TaxID=2716224 RepID=A0A7Y0Q6S0_9GAMM|nr:TonB-dependent receptor [Thalassotalea algicola]NMP32299.1 TonB-dependent receptor [Thalassotalea algicola]